MLLTAYPLGLNDHIKHFGCISNKDYDINKDTHYNGFLFKTNKKHRSRRQLSQSSTIDKEVKLNLIKSRITSNNYNPRYMFTVIRSLTNADTTNIMNHTNNTNLNHHKKVYLNKLIESLSINKKPYKTISQKENKENKATLKIPYFSHLINKLKIDKIFSRTVLAPILNTTIETIPKTRICYKLNQTSANYLCNQGKYLRNLELRDIFNIINNDNCNCVHSNNNQHLNHYHKHIITGNFSHITNDLSIIKYLEYGSKFRTNDKKIINDIPNFLKTVINSHMNSILKKTKIICNQQTNSIIDQYINECVTTRIIKWNTIYNERSNENNNVKEKIKKIQQNYVITIIDKASNNYAITCKNLYTKLLMDELGFEGIIPKGNNTYNLYSKETEETITLRHKITTFTLLKIDTEITKNNALPIIYAIPKMHKTPIKMRFISGAHNSSIKDISITLHNILSHFRNHFYNYCNIIRNRTKINKFWSINNTQSLTKFINENNFSNNHKLYCADFASLFTNLPHSIVIKEISYILDICFKNSSGKTFIYKTGKQFNYCDHSKTSNCYDRNDILFITNYILNNSFVKFANFIFQQIRGIPQGNNASSLLADLTLAAMEFRYSTEHPDCFNIKSCMNFRYVDDILCISTNIDNFINNASNIYHNSLSLEKTSTNEHTTNFLDLSIKLGNGKIHSKLYNKTDDYNFKIIKYTKADSVIPRYIHFNIISTEILRFARCCNKIEDFYNCCSNLREVFIQNGHSVLETNKMIITCLNKHTIINKKFNTNKDTIRKNIKI
jgi:hypothetical protein